MIRLMLDWWIINWRCSQIPGWSSLDQPWQRSQQMPQGFLPPAAKAASLPPSEGNISIPLSKNLSLWSVEGAGIITTWRIIINRAVSLFLPVFPLIFRSWLCNHSVPGLWRQCWMSGCRLRSSFIKLKTSASSLHLQNKTCGSIRISSRVGRRRLNEAHIVTAHSHHGVLSRTGLISAPSSLTRSP